MLHDPFLWLFIAAAIVAITIWFYRAHPSDARAVALLLLKLADDTIPGATRQEKIAWVIAHIESALHDEGAKRPYAGLDKQ